MLNRIYLASIYARPDNKKLTWFKDRMQKLIVAQSVPAWMSPGSDQEEAVPGEFLENFVSWYRLLSQDQGVTLDVT